MSIPLVEGVRLTHRFNPELGAGSVVGVDGRSVIVRFPDSGTELRLAASTDALIPFVLEPGTRARHVPTGRSVIVEEVLADGEAVRLLDGQVVEESELWPEPPADGLVERLAAGKINNLERFAMRLDSFRLAQLREADGLGSFLGGRIRLFPHQLYAAERATQSDPVRWLLADEVGLGKTVEACLILNHLLRTGRASRTMVIAPETLTVQWLGELWRKYHQVFVLLDDKRLLDVEKEFGADFNPFDTYDAVVLSHERLAENPRLAEQAVEAGVDLVIVDEAHHIRRPEGHPGNPLYRAVEPLAAMGRHLLLLTATPLEDDAFGFLRLLQLLRPDDLPEDEDFEEHLEKGYELPPCTSATRRSDIGGLPPRVGVPVEVASEATLATLEMLASLPHDGPLERRRKVDLICRALASAAALEAALDKKKDAGLLEHLQTAAASDPRLEWLAGQVKDWHAAGEKTLVFVAHKETLDWLKRALEARGLPRVGVFHEGLSAKQRDIGAAQFRLPDGPSILVSTESGGEGRNFEFCARLVLFDLPWNPMVVEQRIGRLDRIGRVLPVEVVYFEPPSGVGQLTANLYRRLGLFEKPLGAFERELGNVEGMLEDLALGVGGPSGDPFAELLGDAREAYGRVEEAAYRELHRDPYRADYALPILARVPEELQSLMRTVIVGACEELGLQVESHQGGKRYSIEFDARARIDSLPEVGTEASYLGSFDRLEAVEDESIDFFASGHPLVEGILSFLDDTKQGRTSLFHIPGTSEDHKGFGLLAVYKNESQMELAAIDSRGQMRPDWLELVEEVPFPGKVVPKPKLWLEQKAWPSLVRRLGTALDQAGLPGRLVAVAGMRVT